MLTRRSFLAGLGAAALARPRAGKPVKPPRTGTWVNSDPWIASEVWA